jgi:hypothetical protein
MITTVVTAIVLALVTLVLIAIITFYLVYIAAKIYAEVDVPQLPRGQVIANETTTHLPENCDESSDDANCAAFQVKVCN